jgi:hypothetical protein
MYRPFEGPFGHPRWRMLDDELKRVQCLGPVSGRSPAYPATYCLEGCVVSLSSCALLLVLLQAPGEDLQRNRFVP